jgi:hypothetical protein
MNRNSYGEQSRNYGHSEFLPHCHSSMLSATVRLTLEFPRKFPRWVRRSASAAGRQLKKSIAYCIKNLPRLRTLRPRRPGGVLSDRKCPGTGQSSGIFTSANKATRADHEARSDNLVTYSNATTRDTSRVSARCSRNAIRDRVRIWYKVAKVLDFGIRRPPYNHGRSLPSPAPDSRWHPNSRSFRSGRRRWRARDP